jgi:hypothetical protein
MQSDPKEIYKLTAIEGKGTEQEYKDIGNFVFNSLYANLRRPKSLIIKLKGVGTWFLRRKRMQIVIDVFPPNFNKKSEDFDHPLDLLKHENKIEIYNIFKERLKEYDEYIKDREEVKKKRYERQSLLKPTDGESESS